MKRTSDAVFDLDDDSKDSEPSNSKTRRVTESYCHLLPLELWSTEIFFKLEEREMFYVSMTSKAFYEASETVPSFSSLRACVIGRTINEIIVLSVRDEDYRPVAFAASVNPAVHDRISTVFPNCVCEYLVKSGDTATLLSIWSKESPKESPGSIHIKLAPITGFFRSRSLTFVEEMAPAIDQFAFSSCYHVGSRQNSRTDRLVQLAIEHDRGDVLEDIFRRVAYSHDAFSESKLEQLLIKCITFSSKTCFFVFLQIAQRRLNFERMQLLYPKLIDKSDDTIFSQRRAMLDCPIATGDSTVLLKECNQRLQNSIEIAAHLASYRRMPSEWFYSQ